MNCKPLLVVLSSAIAVSVASCNNDTHTGGGDMAVTLACPTGANYPAGPYGTGVGDVMADFCIRVQRGTGAPTNKALSKYREELLAANYKVLAIASAAEWCGPCRGEQGDLITQYTTYEANKAGAAYLLVLAEAAAGVLAGDSNVQAWATQYSIPFDLASDMERSFSAYFTPTYPNYIVVKLKDMTIEYFHSGIDTAGFKAGVDAALK